MWTPLIDLTQLYWYKQSHSKGVMPFTVIYRHVKYMRGIIDQISESIVNETAPREVGDFGLNEGDP